MTADSINRMAGQLQNVLDRAVDEKAAAGINLLVKQDGEELAYVQSGYADVAAGRKFGRDTIMRMFSMSKPITGAAAMILVQRGMISLGEPVSKYIPGFKDQPVWKDDKKAGTVRRPANLRDLLSMTSGLPYGDPCGKGIFKEVAGVFENIDDRLYTDHEMTTLEIADALGRAGAAFDPGDSWLYGTSADIMGAVIEKVSGQRYGDFLKKEIFEPLGMSDTGFYVTEDKKDRLAQAYERRNGELVLFETNNLGIKYRPWTEPAFQSGGAGIISTIDDYSKFASMMTCGGTYNGKTILEPAVFEYATGRRLNAWQEEVFNREWDGHSGYSYGCLMQHMVDPHKAYHLAWMDEYGWDGWLGTYFVNSPHNKVTIIMGMQVSNPEGNLIYEKVRNTIGQYIDH